MGEIPETLLTETLGLAIWNDIKDFGSSFWVFMVLFNIICLKQQWIAIFNAIVEKIKYKRNHKSYTLKDVINHPVFRNIDYWLEVGIKAITFRNNLHPNEEEAYASNKDKMAKEIMRISFETFKESITKYLNENDLENMECMLAHKYLQDCLSKNGFTLIQKLIERGISQKFLTKYYIFSKIHETFLSESITHFFDEKDDLTTLTRVYLSFNAFNSFLNIVFNHLSETIVSINGDLKDELFDGEPMGKSEQKKVLPPPHSSYVMIMKEKLRDILQEFNGCRAYVYKFFTKEDIDYLSIVYENTIVGITSEIRNLQAVPLDKEKDIYNIISDDVNIVADISKFSSTTIEMFNSRGIKGIIIAPLFIEGKLEGALCIDYMDSEIIKSMIKDKQIDEKLNKYKESLAHYIEYPKDYKY